MTAALMLLLAAGQDRPPVTFSAAFEGGALGRVEQLAPDRYRIAVPGQQDRRGRNRQATWYHFRLDHVRGRDVTLTLHDFVGEYNDRPGAVPMTADIRPVTSDDGRTWSHVPAMDWEADRKEATIRVRPAGDSLWVAHVPPYTPADLAVLLADVDRSPHALVEVVGRTPGGRDLTTVTVTNPAVPDADKRVVWLLARQHAWEAGTSHVMDAALRYAISDDETARRLRDRVVMKFTPMGDPDGCAAGRVRFNAGGYDLNRHWAWAGDRLTDRERLRLMPEIWYTRRSITGFAAGRPVDLLVNLHNTETGEYLATRVDDPAVLARLRAFAEALKAGSSYDPSSAEVRISTTPDDLIGALWNEHRIPAMLLEQRIASSAKLGRRPTTEDRRAFGRAILTTMAETVLRRP